MSGLDGDATLSALDRSGDPPPRIAAPAEVRIGRYVLRARLGAGGMGVVYAARDTELARDVALKLVRPRGEVASTQARLHREAQAMARLSHPNVVPVFDLGTHDGQLFIAMELVAGKTLRSWIGQRPWREVVRLFARAGRGLAAAHAAGLLHRDFKPDNVIVGPGDEPRITDFGLARELEDRAPGPEARGDVAPGEVATSGLAGTPAYMAPEQLRGEPSGAAADQFSFCVALYEVLYGVRPFAPGTIEARIAEIRAARIARPARRAPRWLHAAIVRGLAFEPARRWPSLRALVEALERGRRRRVRGAVVVAVAVAVGLAVVMVTRGRAPGCLDAVAGGDDAVTLVACKDEYVRGRAPRIGVAYAAALQRTHQLGDARAIAEQLVVTPAGADALYTLGRVADEEDRMADAERLFELAAERHRGEGRWADAAADLLARVATSQDVVAQLVDLDRAAIEARRGGSARFEGYAHLSAARLLAQIGARDAALGELARAAAGTSDPRGRVQLALETGNVHKDLGDWEPAAAAFAEAFAGAQAEGQAQLALSALLNLVYALAEAGRVGEAGARLAEAAVLDPGDRMPAPRRALEARVAAHAGDAARAAALIEQAIARTDADDGALLVELEGQRAELALARGALADAARSARRAIARIEAPASPRTPVGLRAWLITDQRLPYETLFASLARAGDAGSALLAFDRIRGRDLLAGLIRSDDAGPAGGARIAGREGARNVDGFGARRPGAAGAAPAAEPAAGLGFPAGELARWLPAVERSALAEAPSPLATHDTVRGYPLLALVIAHDELWRITAIDGRLEVASIGALAALRPELDRLRSAPEDPAVAAALGAKLLPAALAASARPLFVVLDERLRDLPVAALRIGERRLGAVRPIVRASRVAALGCAPAGPRPARSASTRAALRERGVRVELVGEAARDALGDALVLGDGPVRALELAGEPGVASQLVVRHGTAALAMALVAAGADQVVTAVDGTPIAPALAARLLRAEDLAVELSRAQRDDDHALRLAVFGQAICNPNPED